jgi:glycosyltransferase involved in cell wall biosynthesis
VKICLVSQEFPPETAHGGIGTQTWNKSRMLTQLGHEVHVLSAASGSSCPDLQTKPVDGVHVHRMQPPGSRFEVNSPAAYAVGYSWQVLRHLRDLSQQHRFDLINFPEYAAEGFSYQLDRTAWNWTPVIVQLHGPLAMFAERIGWPEPGSDHHRIVTFMEGESIRLADGLMASSANIADFTANYYGVARESIHVVHCGIDCEMFSPAEDPAAALNGKPPAVLFVGNIVGSKGAHVVFDAVMRLRSKYQNIRVQFLGKGDEAAINQFKRRAREAGDEAAVEFLGFKGSRAELPAVYRAAHVFASPAQHETGVANVYVEAMACGCPVVASNSGGATEAVLDGQSGILVNPRDVEATAAAFDRILGDRELRLRMGAAGRRRALEYFAVEKYIARVMAAYDRAIECSKVKLAQLQKESG